MCSAVSQGSSIYVFGGVFQGTKVCQEILYWKPGQYRWEMVPSKSFCPDLYSHSAVFYQEEMWVFGPTRMNVDDGNRVFQVWAINFEMQEWRLIEYNGQMPYQVVQSAESYSTMLIDKYVYFFTSQGVYAFNLQKQCLSCFYKPGEDNYDTLWWQTYQANFYDGQIIVAGWGDPGVDCGYKHLRDASNISMWTIDPISQKWKFLACYGRKPAAMGKFRAILVKNLWIFYGGCLLSSFSNSSAATHICNLDTMTWSQLDSDAMYPPSSRSYYAVTNLCSDTAVFIGGYQSSSSISPSASDAVDCLRLLDDPLHDNERWTSVKLGSVRHKLNLADLYCQQHLSDVAVVVQGTTIPVHKVVLHMCSNYFQRMWEANMKESQTSKVYVDEVQVDTMKIVLQYAYGCLQCIPIDKAADVFMAADRFNVEGLRQACISVMCDHISSDNVVDLWRLSRKHGLYRLEALCVDKICAYVCQSFLTLDDLNGESQLLQLVQQRKNGLHPSIFLC
eukprot:TRINITY_DN5952_c2_g1_i4.p1 TRINITY_DN5952_c2_g1~~TRINITY_DN5952_c2_g1_i4.p1  ORF type:complete len:504 (+),score=15.03 TRINITY_DN5952_c2_g1_i4:108-1619(+)